MPQWVLPVFIFAVWLLWLKACELEVALEDARQPLPEAQRRGVSILPGIPVFPLAFWGLAWAIDQVVNPRGSTLVGAFHVTFGGFLVFAIVRDHREIRKIDRLI